MRFVHTEDKQALSFVTGFMWQLLLVLSKKETVFLKMFGKHVKEIRHGESMSLSAVGHKCTLDNTKLSQIDYYSISSRYKSNRSRTDAI